jgi:hypothetical protein
MCSPDDRGVGAKGCVSWPTPSHHLTQNVLNEYRKEWTFRYELDRYAGNDGWKQSFRLQVLQRRCAYMSDHAASGAHDLIPGT